MINILPLAANYGIPVQLITTTYYLELKQRRLLLDVEQRLTGKQHLWSRRLLRRYVQLCNEVSDYNRFWSVNIAIMIHSNAVLITYLAYQVFLQSLPIYYTIFMFVILIFQLCCVHLVLRCARIAHLDGLIIKHFHRLLNNAAHKRYWQTSLGNELTLQNIHAHQVGFTTVDNRLITSYSYLEIFINTTYVFFLVFKD